MTMIAWSLLQATSTLLMHAWLQLEPTGSSEKVVMKYYLTSGQGQCVQTWDVSKQL
jgi:hypothetical protein